MYIINSPYKTSRISSKQLSLGQGYRSYLHGPYKPQTLPMIQVRNSKLSKALIDLESIGAGSLAYAVRDS